MEIFRNIFYILLELNWYTSKLNWKLKINDSPPENHTKLTKYIIEEAINE